MGNIFRIESPSESSGFGPNSLIGQAVTELFNTGEGLLALADQLRISELGVSARGATGGQSVRVSRSQPSKAAFKAWAIDEYRRRRARSDVFGANMLREPAWDILLDLFIAHLDGAAVRVSSACIAACVPATTGLRWLAVLEGEGLVMRTQDYDARASQVALTKHGAQKMIDYVSAMIEKEKGLFNCV